MENEIKLVFTFMVSDEDDFYIEFGEYVPNKRKQIPKFKNHKKDHKFNKRHSHRGRNV